MATNERSFANADVNERERVPGHERVRRRTERHGACDYTRQAWVSVRGIAAEGGVVQSADFKDLERGISMGVAGSAYNLPLETGLVDPQTAWTKLGGSTHGAVSRDPDCDENHEQETQRRARRDQYTVTDVKFTQRKLSRKLTRSAFDVRVHHGSNGE